VKREKGVLRCSCLESIYSGIPCKHELCICIKETLDISNLFVNNRWSKDFFKIIQQPEEIKEEDFENEDDGEQVYEAIGTNNSNESQEGSKKFRSLEEDDDIQDGLTKITTVKEGKSSFM